MSKITKKNYLKANKKNKEAFDKAVDKDLLIYKLYKAIRGYVL